MAKLINLFYSSLMKFISCMLVATSPFPKGERLKMENSDLNV